MPLQRAALYLLMQFEDVVCQCQQNGLTQDIRTPSRKKAAKSKGSLDLCKGTLCLDAAVHSTPYCRLYAGFNCPFFIASSFIRMKVAS